MKAGTRVLHIIPSIGPKRGGPSVVIRTMARSQAEAGMDVHVATTDDDGTGRLIPTRDIPTVEEGVTYWIFRRQTRFYSCSLPMTRWLWKHIAKFDLVHIHALFSYPSVAAATCARFAGVPYIVRPLGTLAEWGMRNRRPWLKKASFHLIESRIVKNAATVHYTCEQEKLEAEQLGVRHRAVVVPNPVDVPVFVNARGAFVRMHPEMFGRTVVLFLSRLDPKKGLDLLLTAFARVRIQCPDALLVLAGDGDPTFIARLQAQIRELKLESGILWVGLLSGEDKRAAFADAHLFVLPSRSENFGVAVVEAMGAGLPVVVSDQVGLHREIAEMNAGLVVPCSAVPLESAILDLVQSANLRRTMSVNAVRLAGRFSPGTVVRQIAGLYEHIYSTSKRPVAV